MTDKSASELEREAETARAKVADTAEVDQGQDVSWPADG